MSSKIILSSAFAASVNGIMDFGDLYEPWPIPSENGMPLTLDGGLLNRAKDHGDSLVLFHAPWCGHCVTLEPEFEKASQIVNSQEIDATLATFDGSLYAESVKEQKIQQYPTMRWYTAHGDTFDYTGPRKANLIAQWVRFMKIDPIKDVVTVPIPDSDKVHVTLVAPKRTTAFERVAMKYRLEAKWSFVENDTIDEPKVIVHRIGEQPSEMFDVENNDALAAFFLRNRLATFGPLTKTEYPKYVAEGNVSLVYVLVSHETEEELHSQIETLRPQMSKIAKRWWDKFAFVYVDTNAHSDTLRDSFGVTEFPAVAVTNAHNSVGDRYILNGDVDPVKIHEFLMGIVGGTTRPAFKSEDIPQAPESPVAVQKVVGKSIMSDVFRPDRDFFLEVHAPWCVHCRTTGPQVEECGKSVLDLSASDLIQFGRINGQLNDSPSTLISWEHFPTLLYVKAGSHQKIEYTGERTKTAMLSFIAENTEQKSLSKVLCAQLKNECASPHECNLPSVCATVNSNPINKTALFHDEF